MDQDFVIKAHKREIKGKQVKLLRREGKLPAILYGKHMKEPLPIMLDERESNRVLARAGSSSLVTLDVDGEKHTALVRDKQRDYILGNLLHVDFLQVSMTEKLRTSVRLELDGEAPAVADFGGIIVTGLTEVEVECLPSDLPSVIHVDISKLENIGDAIHVRDLVVSDKVTILSDADEMVVQVTPPMGEEAEEVPEARFEPEVIEKGKKEEEEE